MLRAFFGDVFYIENVIFLAVASPHLSGVIVSRAGFVRHVNKLKNLEMKRYKIKIIAVKLGSIGKRGNFTARIDAENEEQAILKLYESFEHITIVEINGKKYSYEKI